MDAEALTAIGTILSAIAASLAVVVTWVVYKGQTRLSQRQLLLPLWQYISTLSDIDPQAPIGPDILKIVNTLELVALSCEGGMVDARVIKRTFRDVYLRLYEKVQAVPNVPGLNKSGADLLRENPAAMRFFRELQTEHENSGSLKK